MANKEKAVNNNCSKRFWSGRAAYSVMLSLMTAFAVLAASGIATAQEKKDEITFNLVPNPQSWTVFAPIGLRSRGPTPRLSAANRMTRSFHQGRRPR
jgi:hypothetical protein